MSAQHQASNSITVSKQTGTRQNSLWVDWPSKLSAHFSEGGPAPSAQIHYRLLSDEEHKWLSQQKSCPCDIPNIQLNYLTKDTK